MNIPTPTVTRMDEHDAYLAWGDAILTYGVGDTPEEAVADYTEDAIELYEWLSTNRDKLAKGLQGTLAIFES